MKGFIHMFNNSIGASVLFICAQIIMLKVMQ